MRDRGTTRAKNKRKKLDFSRKFSSLSKDNPYKIIINWEEFNVGTEDFEVQITLIPGYSFEVGEHDNKRGFSTVQKAMIAARNAVFCGCIFCRKPGK
jgi:hypothetical protein